MIKIALIRNVSPTNFGGIKKHCIELYSLFENDSDILIQPIVDIPTKKIPILKKTMFKNIFLYKYLKRLDCDIVHIHGFASFDVIQVFFISKLLRKKIVYSPHYHPFKYLQHPFQGKLFFYGCLRFILHFASAIVTITKNDTDFFQKYHKNIFRIPHFFEPVNYQKTVHKKKNMILFVGRNDENKGISHLYHLSSKYEVHLVTTGDVKRKDFIIHRNISNEELDDLYNQASLVVIPSRYEAFSYVALEAFAHNTPVVMSNTVMIVDYLIGLKGFKTFDYGNEKEFLQAVETTIGIPVDRERILKHFEKHEVRKMYKDMYMHV